MSKKESDLHCPVCGKHLVETDPRFSLDWGLMVFGACEYCQTRFQMTIVPTLKVGVAMPTA